MQVATSIGSGHSLRVSALSDRRLWLEPWTVAAAGVDPYQHFLIYGWKEGRDPDGLFETDYYLAHDPDVAAAGVDPLLHYDQYGWQEGRDPSALFSTLDYLSANPDVFAAHVDPLEHFLDFGLYEGRIV